MASKLKRCVTEVVGGFWGDEGKGRVASFEARDARLVLRTTGGNNAGHTVYYEGNKIPLHLVPGGIIYPGTIAMICNGVVVNPQVLLEEIKLLSKYIQVSPQNFTISDGAHIIMPYHIDLDELQEEKRGNSKIGTTKRGIGPCYEDQAARIGIRFQDLFLPENELANLINIILKFHEDDFEKAGINYSVGGLIDYLMKAKYNLQDYIGNQNDIIFYHLNAGNKIVIEGAQADHLDILNGDYPNCTSSQCNPSGTLSGAGIGPTYVDKVIVTTKAYCSRVGNGPFPTELFGEEANVIRELGHEYGTTTGRPRRCGWLDLVALSKTRGYTDMCLNHLDTIGLIGKKLGVIKVCTKYLIKKKNLTTILTSSYPSTFNNIEEIKPLYETFEGGWEISKDCKTFDSLPAEAKEFVNFIEAQTGIPITYIGIGANNEDTIVRI